MPECHHLPIALLLNTGESKKKKKKKKTKKKKMEQSDPPRVGLSKLFSNGAYPEGEIQQYKDEYVLYNAREVVHSNLC